MSRIKVLLGSAFVVALAGLALAAGASAHTMSEAKARNAAQKVADKLVRKKDDYYSAVVTSCKRLFPHRVRCRIGFVDEDFRHTGKHACVDTLMMIYKAHDDDEPGNPRVYYTLVDGHPCVR